MNTATLPLHVIHNETEYREALVAIDRLINAAAGTPEYEQLELLGLLVATYEDEHHEIEPPTAIQAIEFRMDQAELTRKDLEPYIGGDGRVSEVLSGKRPLSKAMIRNLAKGLGIPAEALLQEAPRKSLPRTRVARGAKRGGKIKAKRR